MSAKRRSRDYEPSWTEVTIGALLSITLGAVLGATSLVFKPLLSMEVLTQRAAAEAAKAVAAGEKAAKPRPVNLASAELAAGDVLYIEGTRDSAKSRLAVAKRKTFVGGDSVSLDENELNTLVGAAPWTPPKEGAAAKPAPTAKAPEAKPGEAAPTTDATGLTQGPPNFRIHDGELQIGVPVRVEVFGFATNVIVQARGQFVKRREVFEFEPTTHLVGSCPVSRVPILSSLVTRQIMKNVTVPEDLAEAWAKLSEVALVGSTLKLTMP